MFGLSCEVTHRDVNLQVTLTPVGIGVKTMHRSKHSIRRYEKLSQAFHVAHEEHYTLALTGSIKRLYRTGYVLRKQVKEGKLLSGWWGKKKMYACKRRNRFFEEIPLVKVPHGLTCTEILIRIYLSKSGTLLSDADFSGQAFKPDGGVSYTDGSQILFEYSTKDNFSRKKLMTGKISNYLDHPAHTLVMFVIDASRAKVEAFAKANPAPLWFCDLDTFLKQEYENQLQSPIYIWGESGKTLPIIAPKKSKRVNL